MLYLCQAMKKLIHRFFIYLLTTSIFISGNGVVVAMHTCLSSSIKNVSLFKESSCCSEKNKFCDSGCHDQKESLSSKCCFSEFSYHKVNAPFLLQKTHEVPSINYINTPLFTYSAIINCETGFFHFIPPDISFSILDIVLSSMF